MAYLNELLVKNFKISTVYSKWIGIKSCLLLDKNINADLWEDVKQFLKNNGKDYQPKQAPIFTKEDIITFLRNADDEIYEKEKLALMFGIYGRLRAEDY